jgi:hypothetical protein
VLCEAALEAVLRMDSETPEGQQIFRNMDTICSPFESNLKFVPKLALVLLDPDFRLAMDQLNRPKGGAESTIPKWLPLPNIGMAEGSIKPEQESFIQAALSGQALVLHCEEGFFDFFGHLTKTDIKFGTPLAFPLSTTFVKAPHGLLHRSLAAQAMD